MLARFSRNPNVSELSLSIKGVTLQSQELVKLLGALIEVYVLMSMPLA